MFRGCPFLPAIVIPFLLTLSAAFADPPRIIPAADFFRDPQYASAEISPDGKHIAFLAPDHQRMNIWVCDAGAPFESAKLVTHDTSRGIWDFYWSRDNRYLLYALDSGGDENDHLFRVDLSAPDKPPIDLTPIKGAKAKLLHLPRAAPGLACIEWNNRDVSRFDLGVLDIATGAFSVVAQNPFSANRWLWDSTGSVTAALLYTPNGRVDIQIRDVPAADQPLQSTLESPRTPIRLLGPRSAGYHAIATYSPRDNLILRGFNADRSILYLTHCRDSNTERLCALDTRTGEETVIQEDPEYDLSRVYISRNTRRLLGITCQKERLEIKALDPDFKRDVDFLSKALGGSLQLGNTSDDEQKWIVDTESPTDPATVYLYDRPSGKLTFLYRPCPWLKPEELAEMKPITFQSRDGLKIHGYLTMPRGVTPRGLPAVVMVHGGPNSRDHWEYDPYGQFLANRGYAVLQINFRGSTGYGKKFVYAGYREWGGKMLEDLIDGTDWLVREGVANPNRIGIFGASYGGYATLTALAFYPSVFACGVDLCGVSNLLTFAQNTPPYWIGERGSLIREIGDPEKEPGFLRSRSPLFFTQKIIAPLFIAQGENDPRVKRSEADQMVAALRKSGKPVEYLLKPDEGHGFLKPENRLDFTEKMEAFLAKYLK